jgi:tRNA G18 (ribose-2'-O)-methylase SpoU
MCIRDSGKSKVNVGTLWRSAFQLGAAFIFTVGRRYKRQSSDTLKTPRHIPLWHWGSLDEMETPHGYPLIGVEFGPGSVPIIGWSHPRQAVYLLGAEDNGLTPEAMRRCHALISLPAVRTQSFNVAVAGSLVMYDRLAKMTEPRKEATK